jgi:putative methyltransferase (TIGR04325 family)
VGRPENGYRGIYSSFQEARGAVPRNQPSGYDHPEMAKYYRDLLDGPRLQDYPVIYWLRDSLPGASRLFDLGGHVGVAYYASRRHLDLPAGFVWQVCDLPRIVQEGEAVARERGTTHLRFTVDPADLSGADILHVAGALQYMEEGFVHGLVERAASRPSTVIVQATPLHPDRSFITLQATGHAFCPYTVASRGPFVAGFERLGYRIADQWLLPRWLEVPFHDGCSIDAYSGMVFRRS